MFGNITGTQLSERFVFNTCFVRGLNAIKMQKVIFDSILIVCWLAYSHIYCIVAFTIIGEGCLYCTIAYIETGRFLGTVLPPDT